MTSSRSFRWVRVFGFAATAVALLGAWLLASFQHGRSSVLAERQDKSLQLAIESTPAGNDSAFEGILPFSRISLERTGCFGGCPVFRVEFTSDGNATLDAEAHLPLSGHFKTQIGRRDFARLCQLAELAKLRALKPHYEGGWTDDASYIVRVQAGDQKVEVSDYGAVGPAQLWALAQALDAVRLQAYWVK
jgi:hypothetical protein